MISEVKLQNSKLTELIALLSDGQFHDGNDIGDHLGMTRSAVWKMVKRLQEYGVVIHSVKGRGYQLAEPMILYDREQLLSVIDTQTDLPMKLEIFESIDSTNHYLNQMDLQSGLRICLAERQTQGRGRFARSWHSPFGQNIYLSMGYCLAKDINELAGLSLAVSLATVKAIHHYAPMKGVCVKWPNDIFYDGQKLAGILLDVHSEMHGLTQLVIGVGLNVNMLEKPADEQSKPWTSMRLLLGELVDKNKMTGLLINSIARDMHVFLEQGFAPFFQQWQQYDYLYGRRMMMRRGGQEIMGICRGITETGFLRLEKDQGGVVEFFSGETFLQEDKSID